MYHKIHNLKRNGLRVSQIKKQVELCRDTIYAYLAMNEEEFANFLSKKKYRKKKLDTMKNFVKNLIEQYPEIMATQVEAQLKETFGQLSVHPKTVNNFVNRIREEYQILKPEHQREYEAVEELPYGKQAQVDFGQKHMPIGEKTVRVYFFAISLSRSRFKYTYFQKEPFTSKSAIACFERAFAYYGGIPREIVFDQDRVFMVDENYGDLLLTDEFGRYVSTRPFSLNPCRGYDPESKGKIENVVKYVKYNFMGCRKATDFEDLNRQAMQWLSLTANGKEHQTIRKIPAEEFKLELEHLLEYNRIEIPEAAKEIYNLRKDNLVIYEGNRYRVPAGTYKNSNSRVKLNRNENALLILSTKNEEIIKHSIPTTKGNLIGDKTHLRDYSVNVKDLYDEILAELNSSNQVKEYLEKIKKAKGRYLRDQLSLLKIIVEKYGCTKISEAIDFCNTNNIISIPDLKTVVERTPVKQAGVIFNTPPSILLSEYCSIVANTRSINSYLEEM
jgi:transposase